MTEAASVPPAHVAEAIVTPMVEATVSTTTYTGEMPIVPDSDAAEVIDSVLENAVNSIDSSAAEQAITIVADEQGTSVTPVDLTAESAQPIAENQADEPSEVDSVDPSQETSETPEQKADREKNDAAGLRIQTEVTQRMVDWESEHPKPTEDTHPVDYQRKDAINEWHRSAVAARGSAYEYAAVNEGLHQWDELHPEPTKEAQAADPQLYPAWEERRVIMEATLKVGAKEHFGVGKEPQTESPVKDATEKTELVVESSDSEKEKQKEATREQPQETENDPEMARKRAKLRELQAMSAKLKNAIKSVKETNQMQDQATILEALRLQKTQVDRDIAALNQEIVAGKRGGKLQRIVEWLMKFMLFINTAEQLAATPDDK